MAAPDTDVGDAILKGPELLLDTIFRCTSGTGSRSTIRDWNDDDRRSIMAQILDVQVGARKERIWSEFMTQLTQREMLIGMLVPSANNFAEILAVWTSGSIPNFLARMNEEARALGMTNTSAHA